MIKILELVLILSLYVSLSSAGFLEELKERERSEPALEELLDHVNGYDRHADYFYYNDKQAWDEYVRSKYMPTRVTLGGQNASLTDDKVAKAVRPFVVAQKALVPGKSSLDRWDVKENKHGVQFFGLYHGIGSPFVVNKLRASLLRKLANNVGQYIDILDHTARSEADDKERYVDDAKRELVEAIHSTFQEVDTEARERMEPKQDYAATAAVVIVSDYHIIVANLGDSHIVAYDSSSNHYSLLQQQTEGISSNHPGTNLFGMRKSKANLCEPHIQIFPRSYINDEGDLINLEFLVLATPPVSTKLSDTEMVKSFLAQVRYSRDDDSYEQDMYQYAAYNILEEVKLRSNPFEKFRNPDHAVMIVGLDRAYINIH